MRVCKTITIPAHTSLAGLYAEKVGNYPKFFKMDTLSKLGFLATELLLEGETDRFIPREDRAVLLFSRNGSVCDDSHFVQSMEDYPSPSLFVYTLPNIVAGEIAIRNQYRGETSAFLLEQYDRERIRCVVEEAFQDRMTRSAIVGWLDVRSDTDWTCELSLIEK